MTTRRAQKLRSRTASAPRWPVCSTSTPSPTASSSTTTAPSSATHQQMSASLLAISGNAALPRHPRTVVPAIAVLSWAVAAPRSGRQRARLSRGERAAARRAAAALWLVARRRLRRADRSPPRCLRGAPAEHGGRRVLRRPRRPARRRARPARARVPTSARRQRGSRLRPPFRGVRVLRRRARVRGDGDVLIPACAAWELLAPRSPRSTIAAALRCTPPALVGAGTCCCAPRASGRGRTHSAFSTTRSPSPRARARWLSTARVHGTCAALLLWPATLSADYSLDALPIIDDWLIPRWRPPRCCTLPPPCLSVLAARAAAPPTTNRAARAAGVGPHRRLAFAPAARAHAARVCRR